MTRTIFCTGVSCTVFGLICAFGLISTFGLIPSSALAQTAPDAGTLQQQIERERQQKLLPRRVAPDKPAAPEAMKPSTVAVTVKQFRFAGNTLLKSEELAAAVAGYLNRPLDFAQLQAAAAAVAAAYRQAGWVVRAYLPAQEIAEGILTIQIVEAVFGGARLEGTEASRVGSAQVLDLIQARQKTGEPLNADAIDRALLVADDLPGVSVAGVLAEGARPGETALLVKLADEPLLAGEASTDNTGARSTGRARLSANLILNSPFGRGDLMSANLAHTEGSDYLRLAGSLPVGAEGWRLGASASQLRYRLVAPEFVALGARGTADTAGLDASYPLIRSRLANLYFNANLDRKRYDNESSGATTSRYQSEALSLGLSGNLYDALGGGGANGASLSLVNGKLNLGGSPNQAADATTTRTEGRFTKIRGSLSRQQVLTNDVSLFAAFSGQRAGKNLDSSEKFFLGGASGVRAYPSSEAGGAEGELLNVELRWRAMEGVTLTAFHDRGRVRVNKDNSLAAAAPNLITLKGHGLAASWQTPWGVQLKATWARREGSNPNPTSAGLDQDGSLIRDRLWVTASLPF